VEISQFVNNVIYIIQDIQAIKTKKTSLGGFVKVRLRNDKDHYEIGLGSSLIIINKYKPE
jgi:hypothetical protein